MRSFTNWYLCMHIRRYCEESSRWFWFSTYISMCVWVVQECSAVSERGWVSIGSIHLWDTKRLCSKRAWIDRDDMGSQTIERSRLKLWVRKL